MPTDNAAALKSCPICEREPKNNGRATNEGVSTGAYIHFFFCHGGGYSAHVHVTGYGATPEHAQAVALSNWNTRPIEDALTARLQASEEARERAEKERARLEDLIVGWWVRSRMGEAPTDPLDVEARLIIQARHSAQEIEALKGPVTITPSESPLPESR